MTIKKENIRASFTVSRNLNSFYMELAEKEGRSASNFFSNAIRYYVDTFYKEELNNFKDNK